MSYKPRDPLGDPNMLAERLVRQESAPLQHQIAPSYNPAPPDYSRNKHDPQNDRPLPNTAYSNATMHHQRNHVGNGSRVYREPVQSTRYESGVKDLIQALSGVESEDYVTPIERKPIHQRNKFR